MGHDRSDNRELGSDGINQIGTYTFNTGVTNVTYTVKDAAGNQGTCSFTVTVTDNINPAVTCPGNISKNDDAGACSASVAVANATYTDNCGVTSLTWAMTGVTTGNSAATGINQIGTYTFNTGVTNVTYTVKDAAGNQGTCSFTVTVTDNINPAVTCPGNISKNDDAGVCSASVAVANATYTDNCGVTSLTWAMTGVTTGSSAATGINQIGTYTFNTGVTNVTYTVKDAAGNQGTCSFMVTVTDNIPPVVTCPSDATISCEADNTPTGTGSATATDNCTPSTNITITHYDATTYDPDPANVLHYNYVITRTWTAMDVAGNNSTCVQTITVHDITKPVITCPSDITISCEASSLPASTGTATATDNCAGAGNITITYSDATTYNPDPANVLHYNYVITRTWTATDVAGNNSTCVQTITVHDVTKPVITCPSDITISCEASSLPASTGTATATDNCAAAGNITITYSDATTYNSDPANVLHYNYVITRTWTATDIAGNNSTCIQTITVHDVTKPVITCPLDITISCDGSSLPAGTGTATATDNCAAAGNITITYSDATTYNSDPANVLHYNYVITRTWTATDVAGNNSTCIQTITVHDVTKPVITCPLDITISCDGSSLPAGTGTATATDNCAAAGNITVTYSDATTYNSDPANVLHYNYVITRTWTAMDVAGNNSTCVQTITVHDITKPVITCPSDITISCEASSLPASTGTATATDNCAGAGNITITYSDATTYNPDPANVLHYNYVITRAWTATDVAGNNSTCVQTITVHDVTKPVITCPSDITISCEASSLPASTGTATATDNCAAAGNITITYSDATTYNSDPANVLHYNYVITRTWTARDVAGNNSTCVQTITVHDVTKPVITCPSDITISCEASSLPASTGTATATDNCAAAGNITITYSDATTYNSDPANVLHYNYVITRTWTATDVAGNNSTCIQTITVHDITKPVITCPSDITISCEVSSLPASTGTATATDNCAAAGNITVTYSDATTYNSDPANVLHYNYVITRTWTARDVAGNNSTCVQTITVHDVTAPTFTVPPAVTVCRAQDCTYDISPAETGDLTASSDNCTPSSLLIATYSDDNSGLVDCDNFGFVTRTWNLQDIAGNSTSEVQTIWIEPVPAATILNNNPIICDSSNVSLIFNSPTVSINISNLSFDVNVTSTDPAHLSGSASADFTIFKSQMPYSLTGNLINTSDVPVKVTYTVTPKLSGCSDGNQVSETVWVNPTSRVFPVPAESMQCNNTKTSILLQSPSVFTSSVVTFKITAAASAGVTGFTASASGLPNNYTIEDLLVNSTTEPQNVTYTITPQSPTGCKDGPSVNGIVTVNPTAVITSEATANWCNNVSNTYTATSSSTTAVFNWTRAAVTGISNPAGIGTGSTITETLVNTTTEPVVVHYIITPEVNSCQGTPFDVAVTVNPTAVITSEATANWCNNVSNTYTATSSSSTAVFNWTRAAVTGISNPAGIGTGSTITETLVNTTTEPVVVHYIITPEVNSCQGTPFDVAVTVNPTAVITSEATANWCNNVSNTYTATSSSSTAVFNWTRAAVTGISNPAGIGTGSTITETLVNTTTEPVVVHYIITPEVNSCQGTPFDVAVTVNPTAVITSEATANWCNNVSNTYTATSSSTTAVFNWTRAAVTGISNPAGIGTGSTITETLVNTTTEPVVVHYIITPEVNSCQGTPFDVAVTVNPTAVITSEATANWCNNVSNTYTATSSSSTAVFNWTRAAVTGISNPAGIGTGATITETLVNTTTEPVVVHYIITPEVNSCQGTPFDVAVTVNPTAVITSEATANWCNNVSNTYTATSSSSTAVFNWTRAAVTGISNPAGIGTGSTITETLVNTTTEPVVVHYIITPEVNSCQGTAYDVAVTVNPTAVITSEATANWCNNVSNTYTATSSSTTAVFNWTRAAVTGISNPAGIGTGSTITETLVNTTTEPVVVHYIITPEVNSCQGTPFDLAVTVNPTPVVILPSNQIICNNTATSPISFSTANMGGIVTYTWTNDQPSIGLAGSGSGDIASFTALNPGGSPVIATITVTPHFTNNGLTCDGPSGTFTITINPTAEVDLPDNQVLCNNTNTLPVNFTTTNSGGIITFTWTNDQPSIGLAASGNGNIPSFTALNTGNSPVYATITVTPHFENGSITCDGPSKSFTIIVDPTPQVVPSTLTQTICNYGVTNIVIGSPSSFSSGTITFNYTVTATGGITGFTTPRTGLPKDYLIADTLYNPTDEIQTVTYTIMPVTSTGCASGPAVVIVTVLPTPKVNQPANEILCNGDNSPAVTLSTATIGDVTYTWTNDQPSIGLAASGNGDIPSFVAVNSDDSPLIATISITPHFTFGGLECDGTPEVFTITINPTPRVYPVPLNTAQCDSTATDIILQSPSKFTSGVVTFKFTATATGGVTGFTPSASGLPDNYVIADVLVNPTDSPQTVTYTITPVSPTGCSDGPSVTVMVKVNPTPRVFPVPVDEIICDNGTTGILLQSPGTFTSGVVTFKFTATATGGVTGYTASASGLPDNYVIADVLVNPTDASQTVTYTITPVSPAGCSDGPSVNVVVTVNPTPRIYPVPANIPQCDSTATNIVLQSPSTFTTGVVTFKFTATATGGVTGFTPGASGLLNNYVITDVLVNPTDAPQTVTYTITPVSPTGCSDGPSVNVVVTVNPTQRIYPVPANTSQCDNTATNIVLQSPSTFTTGVVTFKFTATATGGVTGFTSSASGLPDNYVIADVLVNPTDAPQKVTYTITPVSPTGCNDGPSVNVTATVNPTPRIFPVPLNEIICDNGTTSISLQSPGTFTSGVVTFKFTATATGGVTGFTPGASGLPDNYVIADVLANPTDGPQTVTYTITPVSPAGCSDGPSVHVVVTVNPTPRIYPVPANTPQCDSTATNIVLQSPSTFTTGVVTFKFTATATGGVTGYTASASGLPDNYVIADVLVNPTDAPQTVTYTITPVSPTGCSDGPSVNVVVTVNPTPRIYPIPANTSQCDNTATNIVLQSPSTFTSGAIRFKFTAIATGGVTGFTASATGLPNGYIITDVLLNPTDSPQTVTYAVVPISPTGCRDGRTINITVTVNPTPRVLPVPGNTIQCDKTTTNITLQSPSTFTTGVVTFNITGTAPSGLTGYTSSANGLPNDYILADNLVNATDSPITVTYRLVPVSGAGCGNGAAVTFTVTANPTPRATPTNVKPAICFADVTEITLNSPTVMTSGDIRFDYTIGVPSGVTGNSASSSGILQGGILSFQYRNYNDSVMSVLFYITPKATGVTCPAGPISVQEVQVHPKPARGIDITKPFTCEAGTGRAALEAEISKGAAPYGFVWTGPVGYYMTDSIEITNLYAGYYTLSVTDNIGCKSDTAINIANLSASPRIIPYPVLPNINVSCPGGNDGTARIYVKDGITGPYQYWLIRNNIDTVYTGTFSGKYDSSNPSTYRICTGLMAGMYELVIIDINNCEILTTSELDEPPPILITFVKKSYNGMDVSCRGYNDGSVTATVTGGMAVTVIIGIPPQALLP